MPINTTNEDVYKILPQGRVQGSRLSCFAGIWNYGEVWDFQGNSRVVPPTSAVTDTQSVFAMSIASPDSVDPNLKNENQLEEVRLSTQQWYGVPTNLFKASFKKIQPIGTLVMPAFIPETNWELWLSDGGCDWTLACHGVFSVASAIALETAGFLLQYQGIFATHWDLRMRSTSASTYNIAIVGTLAIIGNGGIPRARVRPNCTAVDDLPTGF